MNAFVKHLVHLLAASLLVCRAQSARKSQGEAYHFAWISDIHVDPLYRADMDMYSFCREGSPLSTTRAFPRFPYGQYGCDAPPSLMQLSFEHVAQVFRDAKPAQEPFILVTGDFAAHYFGNDDCKQAKRLAAIANATGELVKLGREMWRDHTRDGENAAGKSVQIIPCVGNNDLRHNYYSEEGDDWSEALIKIWDPFLRDLTPDAIATFRRGMYYSIPVKAFGSQKITAIVLNTMWWARTYPWEKLGNRSSLAGQSEDSRPVTYVSSRRGLRSSRLSASIRTGRDVGEFGSGYAAASNAAAYLSPAARRRLRDTMVPPDPAGQLAWLRQSLEDARKSGAHVIILGHIPPGTNVNPGRELRRQWRMRFEREYTALVDDYRDVILGQFYGHYHMDSFRLLTRRPKGPESPIEVVSSVLLGPAISISHGNFPGWRRGVIGEGVSDDKHSLVAVEGANQLMPAVRKRSMNLLDYTQYAAPMADNRRGDPRKKPIYQPLYTFRELFQLPDVSTRSMVALVEKLEEDDELMRKFWSYRVGGRFLSPRVPLSDFVYGGDGPPEKEDHDVQYLTTNM